MEQQSVEVKRPSHKSTSQARILGRRKFLRTWSTKFNDLACDILFSKQSSDTILCLKSNIYVLDDNGESRSVKVRTSNSAVLFSDIRKDDKILAVAFENGHVDLVDFVGRRTIASFAAFSEKPLALRLFPNSKLVCISSKRFSTFDYLGNRVDELIFEFEASAALVPCDEYALLSVGNRLILLDFSLLELKVVYEGASSLGLIASSPQGLVCCVQDSAIVVLSRSSGDVVAKFRPHLKTITFLDVSSDGRLVFSASLDGIFLVTEIFSGIHTRLIKAPFPIIAAAKKDNDLVSLALSDGSITTYSSRKQAGRASSPTTARGQSFHPRRITALLRKFEYSEALQQAFRCEDLGILSDTVLILHYNGFLIVAMDRVFEANSDLILGKLERLSRSPKYLDTFLLILGALLAQSTALSFDWARLSDAFGRLMRVHDSFMCLSSELELYSTFN